MPQDRDELIPFRAASPDPRKTAQTQARTLAQQEYLRHLVHRQVVEVPPAQRALFLAPHPDDIVIGCGGTLLKMLARGVTVRLAYMTDGCTTSQPGGEAEMARIRADEARAVSSALGLPEPILLGADERTYTHPENERGLTGRLAELLDEVDPDHVFLPDYGDVHGDHRYTNHLLAGALRLTGRRPDVYGYEVWSIVPPGVIVDITAELEEKKRLLSLYPSQLALLDYLTIAEAVARLRAPLAPGAQASEVFHAMRGEAFVERCAELDLASPDSLRSEVILMPPETAPAAHVPG